MASTLIRVSSFALTTPRLRGVAQGATRIAGSVLLSLVVLAPAHGQGFPIHTFSGTPNPDPLLPYPGMGTWVSVIQDLSGDGTFELAVSAPSAFVGMIQQAGQAYVYSGADGSPLFAFSGSTVGEGFGYPIACGGDVNLDGVPDVIVGAIGADPGGVSAAGQAHVLSGASGAPLHTFDGTMVGSRLGYSVAGAGDVNGDGHADVVVGAPYFLVGIAQPGQVKVFSGADGSVLHTFTGPGNFDHAGISVAGGRDVDGDGVPDVAVGAPTHVVAGIGQAGRIRVYSGASGAVIHDVFGTEWGKLGTSVAFLDDVDGDGIPDFVGGVPEYSSGTQSTNWAVGKAVVFSGASGTVLRELVGKLAWECLGHAVAPAGEVDGDGVPDVVLGSRFCGTGTINQAGRAVVFSGADGSVLFVLSGAANGDYFGIAVDGGKDVDQDGVPDVFVGAPSAGPAGEAYLYSVVGLPPGVTEVGTGCAGTGGFAPKAAAYGGSPTPGNPSFGLSVSKGPGGGQAALFAGTAVDPAGALVAGCPVHLAGGVLWVGSLVALGGTPGTAGGGHRLVRVWIPPIPSLPGGTLHFQWAVFDGGAPNGLFVTSNALSVTIQ